MKFTIFSLLVLAATMASAAPNAKPGTDHPAALSAQSLTLAWRLNSDTGGFEKIAWIFTRTMAGVDRVQLTGSPQLYLKAFQQTLDHHRKDVTLGNALIAEHSVQVLTLREMSDEIAFWESPVGRSIRQKQDAFAATISPDQMFDNLTAEEEAALTAFGEKNKHHGSRKEDELAEQMLAKIMPLLQSISHDALKKYCNDGGDCSKAHFPAIEPAAK